MLDSFLSSVVYELLNFYLSWIMLACLNYCVLYLLSNDLHACTDLRRGNGGRSFFVVENNELPRRFPL